MVTTVINYDPTGVAPSGVGLYKAYRSNDVLSAIQAAFEHAGALGRLPHYGATGMRQTVKAATIIETPARLDSLFTSFSKTLQHPGVKEGLASLGIVIYSFEIIVHLFQIYKECRVRSATAEVSNDQELLTAVQKLQTLNINFFKTSLPDHLKERIEKLGDKNALSYFESEIRDGRPETAKRVVRDIHEYTFRKTVFHIFSIAAAICGLLSSIALLVAFPPALVLVISALGIVLMIVCFAMKKGWVENPNEGFNAKLLLPAFMRKGKLAVKPTPDAEMDEKERVLDIDRLRDQAPPVRWSCDYKRKENLSMQDLAEHIKLVTAMTHGDEVSDDDAIAFTKPVVVEEKSLLERIKSKFGPKKEKDEFESFETIADLIKREEEISSLSLNRARAH